jgi:hypothetical protein
MPPGRKLGLEIFLFPDGVERDGPIPRLSQWNVRKERGGAEMEARAEKLKHLLCVKTPEAVERASDETPRPIKKNAGGVTQTNLVSKIEDDVDISSRNNSVIVRRQSPRIVPDRPIALDEPSQHRVWLELIEGHQSQSSHTCNDLQRL